MLLASMVAGCMIGTFDIGPSHLWALLTGGAVDDTVRVVMTEIRLPRVLLGAFVGAALACSGSVMQALFRNPLADPSLIGTSAGASSGAVTMIVVGKLLLPAVSPSVTVPVGACLGAVAAVIVVYRLATVDGRTSVPVMLLAGIAINAFAWAVVGFWSAMATDAQVKSITFWTLGSLSGVPLPTVLAYGALVFVALPWLHRQGAVLNAIAMGDRTARHTGVAVQRLVASSTAVVTLLVALGVAMSGTISFVGLVVPHLVRQLVGSDHRRSLMASGLAGATLLVLADLLCRTVAQPQELPLGVLTAMVGVPFFIVMVLRQRRHGGMP